MKRKCLDRGTRISLWLPLLVALGIGVFYATASYPTDVRAAPTTADLRTNAEPQRDLYASGGPPATLSPSGGDDTGTLQKAISASNVGERIQLACGTFQVSSTLTFGQATIQASNILFEGCGTSGTVNNGGTVLKWTGPLGGTVVRTQGLRDSLFRDFAIAAGANTPAVGIDIDTATGVTSTNNSFENISVLTGTTAAVEVLDGASAGGNDLHTFRNVVFDGGGTDDLLINNAQSKFIKIYGGDFTGAGTNGLRVGPNGGSFQLFGSNFDQTLTGIAVKIEARTDTNSLIGCQVETSNNHPRFLTLPATIGAFLVVEGCRFSPTGIHSPTTVISQGAGASVGLTIIGNDFSDGTYNTNVKFALGGATLVGNLFPNATAGNYSRGAVAIGNVACTSSNCGTLIPFNPSNSTGTLLLANSQPMQAMNAAGTGTVNAVTVDSGNDVRLGDGTANNTIRPQNDNAQQLGYSNARWSKTETALLGFGAEDFRIVRGRVAPNGTVSGGAGFTSSRNSPGNYTISFSPSLGSTPSCTATVEGPGAASATVLSPGVSAVTILTFDGLPSATDEGFDFSCIG
jgi:hypothetical protein